MSVYNTPELQCLKNRLMASIDISTDKEKLEQCLDLLQADSMPGVYTDAEFAEELRLSEASGYISYEDALKEFAKWGFVK